MKTLTVILTTFVLVNHILGYFIKIPTQPPETDIGSDHSQWIHLQKLMLPLFENVCETSKNPNICTLAQEFNLDSTDYMKSEAVKSLQNLIASGLLPKGDIFSEYNITHLNELKIIYDVLYDAKDFDTFYKTAAWARQNLNCGLYVNALYMAIQHRKDTEILSIPAPYELLPNYFIDHNVIIQAAKFFDKDFSHLVVSDETIHNEGNSYIIDANYTGLFYDNDDESKLAYFREDIGLNSYYYLMKLRMTPWLYENVDETFGENIFQIMKQLMARYNLERYANGLSAVDTITWDAPIDVPYNPMLMYSNGVEFGHRTSSIELSENENLQLLQTIENNISNVANHLHQRGYNKTHILNHLMEILVTGDRSYETLAKKLLGKSAPNNGYTSVLDHYMTSLRDPIFWNINTKIVTIIDEALKVLPAYTKNELFFPGVEIINIDVKKIITTYDYFTFDVTDALKTEETGFRIKIGQPRLNHKQFTLKVNISSMVSQKGMMKIYLGPQIMPGELAIKKHLFTLLDTCQVNLKIGSNIITRTPEKMNYFSEDFRMLNTIQKNIENAGFGINLLPPKTILSQVGFPSRLMLPKGTAQGLPLQMFVFIAPYIKAGSDESYSTNNYKFNNAILSPGYPLDLNIQDQQLFQLPNAFIKHINIMQKGQSKVENYGGPGITKSWYSVSTYDPSARSNYTSKNQQFGNKKEYSSRSYENRNISNSFKSDEENIESDYNTIYREDNGSNLRINYKGNNYPLNREPFDYKAKKAQYEKKEYSPKTNYTKYHTIINKENDYVESTTVIGILSSAEKNLIDIFKNNLLPQNFDLENDNKTVKEIEVPITEDIQEDFINVEVLPVPAMLKKADAEGEKFNYKVKKTERDDKIKEKKTELDQLIKNAKLKHKMKNQYDEVNVNKKDLKIPGEINVDEDLNLEKIDYNDTNLTDDIENIKILHSHESIEKILFEINDTASNNKITSESTAFVQNNEMGPDIEDKNDDYTKTIKENTKYFKTQDNLVNDQVFY